MANELVLRIFDVEHGACALMVAPNDRLAMIDSGHNERTGWRPSTYLRHTLNRDFLDYFFSSNADQDHLSDLAGLQLHGVRIGAFHRNRSISSAALRAIKEEECELTDDMERYLELHRDYVHPVTVPFGDGMGGVTCTTFCNKYPDFTDTNNLSMATFIKYGGVKFLFPGDLEKAGWRALLATPAFCAELRNTDILIASHHGRENGFCDEVFDHFKPQLVVISDSGVKYETQETVPDYRDVLLRKEGVPVTCVNQLRQRHVLTTRSDGDIIFRVTPDGYFYTSTTRDKYARRAA